MTHNTRAKGKGRQDAGLRKLFCLIEGDHSVFQVQIASDESIINLMEAVHQKENRMLGAKDLVLLKVTISQSPELITAHLYIHSSGRFRP